MTTHLENPLPQWVADAAQLPIAFAQVREDPLLDLDLLKQLGGNDLRVMMIASGGCTAAALAACGRVARLHLTDMNPAQMVLCRLKLRLLQTASPGERSAILGHVATPADERAKYLHQHLAALGMPCHALGPPGLVAELGPDHSGRYEGVFARLRLEMSPYFGELEGILTLGDNAERAARVAPDTELGRAMDAAFDSAMALPILVRLFSAEATRNSREPFSRHFACRTRHALAAASAVKNPWLWQLLLGRFPESGGYPWLSVPAPQRMPEVTESIRPMDVALESVRNEFDFVHLSNILDWLSPEQGRHTLAFAARALRPGGRVLIRQLNSTLDIPALGSEFEWLADDANAMHRRDRSFFYRQLHVGRKR